MRIDVARNAEVSLQRGDAFVAGRCSGRFPGRSWAAMARKVLPSRGLGADRTARIRVGADSTVPLRSLICTSRLRRSAQAAAELGDHAAGVVVSEAEPTFLLARDLVVLLRVIGSGGGRRSGS